MASTDEQRAWAEGSTLIVQAEERCVLSVTGSDRLSWLNGLLTCQLAHAKPGDVVLGLAVAQKGKIVSDVVVVVGAERVHLVVQRATVDALVASFDHHLMMEDAELARSPLAVYFLHGPRSGDALEAARHAAGAAFAGGLFDVTGAGGAVLLATPGDDAETAMRRAASEAGGGAGDAAGWDVVRVLAGVPRFGVDFDDTTYPQEAALERKAVSFDKGCYLGQEVVCMLEMRGHVKRKLVSLALPDGVVPTAHAALEDGKGTTVGEVTSAVPTRGLAMVKYAAIAPGTELTVGGAVARVI
jgi:folate-binding protein YgfZ